MPVKIINCGSGTKYGIVPTVVVERGVHKNKEVSVRIKESVRDSHIIIIQSFYDINNDFIELLMTCDAAVRAGAEYITVIIPYFPYCRMDKRHRSGHPISARVICDALQIVGVNRIISLDLHAEQIEGFVGNGILFDHIPCAAFLTAHLKEKYDSLKDWVFCSPDAGAVKRTKFMADLNGSNDLCIIVKNRVKDGEVDNMTTIGDVKNKNVILVDDMIDSGGTLACAMDLLERLGAKRVIGVATHGIFSDPAYSTLRYKELHVTDAVPADRIPEATVVYPLKPLLNEIIRRVSNKERLSSLFFKWQV